MGNVTISLTRDRVSQQLRESPLVIGNICCYGWCFRAKNTISQGERRLAQQTRGANKITLAMIK